MPYYAVKVGRHPGIYRVWKECELQVKGYSSAVYQKFSTWEQADAFINVDSNPFQKSSYQSNNRITTLAINRSPPQSVKRSINPSEIIVYTDGSCLGNGTVASRAGWGIYFPEHPDLSSYGPLEGSLQTNQRAELTAILKALEITPDTSILRIITDSSYSINCITKWSIPWEQDNWEVKKANLDLIRPIVEMIQSRTHPVEFTHVRGHKGDPGNEEADRLAKLGSAC